MVVNCEEGNLNNDFLIFTGDVIVLKTEQLRVVLKLFVGGALAVEGSISVWFFT